MPGFKRLKPLKPLKPSNSLAAASTSNCCTASSRQLPPSPLAGSLCCSRVAACPLPAHSPLLLGHSSLPFARLQTLKTLKPLKPSNSLAAASKKPSGRQPLLFQGCSLPFACTSLAAHQAPGRQRSSIAACPLPAHSPLLLGHSSLPFARLQTLKTLKTLKTLQLPRGRFPPSPLAVSLCCSRFAACPFPAHPSRQLPPSSQPSAFQPQNPYNPPTAALLPRGSCHQASGPSAFAVPGLQPALCLHIPRGSFHQALWRQPLLFQGCSVQAKGRLQPWNSKG